MNKLRKTQVFKTVLPRVLLLQCFHEQSNDSLCCLAVHQCVTNVHFLPPSVFPLHKW